MDTSANISANTIAQPASLVRGSREVTEFPAMDAVDAKIARCLSDIISQMSSKTASVEPAEAQVMTHSSWIAAQDRVLGIGQYRMTPVKGNMAIAIPQRLITRIVDGLYGGGADCDDRGAFSKSEARCLERIMLQILSVLPGCWMEFMSVNPVLHTVETELSSLRIGKDAEKLLIRNFSVHIGQNKPDLIHCIYPVSALSSVETLDGRAASLPRKEEDLDWRWHMRQAVMLAHLPVRTVFARPELPVAKLMSLKPGDIIPICLPKHVPLTVAGRLFAHGTVGEVGGRTAIAIEKLEQIGKIEQGKLIHE